MDDQSEVIAGRTACVRLRCSSGQPARVYPMLILRGPRRTVGTCEAFLRLPFCHACARATFAQDLISDEGWKIILRNLRAQGMLHHGIEPVRARTQVRWVLIGGAEAERAEAAMDGKPKAGDTVVKGVHGGEDA